VTADALRQIRGGHPWIFDGSITSTSHDGAPGDLAVVFDDRRNFAAIGLWDPASPIRVRILSTRQEPIGGDFWAAGLAAADRRRPRLLGDVATTGLRRIHGENDQMPGLVADQYGDTLVLKLYSAVWFAHLTALIEQLQSVWNPERIVVRLARNLSNQTPPGLHDGQILTGSALTGPVTFQENGLRMQADPVAGQKTGYFLDQRANRSLVQAMALDARVLDVFCCHGGFSVHAAAGGARSVHATDLSPHATAAAAEHLRVNTPNTPFDTTTGDAFDVMDQLAHQREQFDLVVVDPPSFAPRAAAVPGALRAYSRLTELAVKLVVPGGALVQASCSSRVSADAFRTTVLDSATRSGHQLTIINETGHDEDHPVGFPEGAYLKAVFATVTR
jgi:23S rRNA (cytosine1962-C5)-methyltransferase